MSDLEYWLCDEQGNQLIMLEDWESIQYSIVSHNVGAMSLMLPYGVVMPSQFRIDRKVQVWRSTATGPLRLKRSYMIRRIRDVTDENGVSRLMIYGRDGLYLLTGRPLMYYAGSAQANKTAPADDWMKAVVRENEGALASDPLRAWAAANFTVEVDFSLGPSVTRSMAYKNVLGILQELAAASQTAGNPIWFDVVDASPTKYQFRTYKGQIGIDRTYPDGFSPIELRTDDETLAQPDLDIDYTDEANVVYVGGPGDGAVKPIVTRTDTVRRDRSLWSRREIYVDASNEDTNGQNAMGDAALWNAKPKVKFSAELGNKILEQYGDTWDVGWKMTAVHRDQQYGILVRGVDIKVDKQGLETIKPKLEFLDVVANLY